MSAVIDINRPDVNGTQPKMFDLCEQMNIFLAGMAPYLSITTSDNLMSSIVIRGTMEPKSKWKYGIFQNATYFIVHVTPNGKRYYDATDDKVTVEVTSASRKMPKFRKYTGNPEKVIAKIGEWLASASK